MPSSMLLFEGKLKKKINNTSILVIAKIGMATVGTSNNSGNRNHHHHKGSGGCHANIA
ncbi:hypothetical protein SESBI_43525 [Sesbania bispinosa]|nr:hypothetical protein SESBI_43525 [Sesbania bispinosa]